MDDNKIVVTNPDPTEAVKEALRLAVETINEKFKTAGQAVVLAHSELQNQLSAMSAGINDKFAGNKELVDQLGKANAVALNAALETQKDLLKQLQISFDTSIKVVNEKIDRLTSRIDTGEGRTGGVDSNRRDERQTTVDNRNYQAVLIGLGVTIVGLIVGWLLYRPQK